MLKKILVVDDETELVDAIKLRLQANNYEVVTASDGEAGLEKAIAEKPNLVMVDIMMPEMDGYTFVKKIKANKLLKDIPIIILTGQGKMEDIFKMEGVADYLVKPFPPEALLDKIAQHLRN